MLMVAHSDVEGMFSLGLMANAALLVLAFQLHNSSLARRKRNASSVVSFIFSAMIAVILVSQDLAFDICGKYE